MSQPKPFKINADQNDIDAILNKVRAYQWHEMPQIEPNADPWIYGTDMSYMKELCTYWLDTFNWRQTRNRTQQVQSLHRRNRRAGYSFHS